MKGAAMFAARLRVTPSPYYSSIKDSNAPCMAFIPALGFLLWPALMRLLLS